MALPDREISNDELSTFIDTSDEWISKRTGIKKRYWVSEGTTTSSLAVEAASKSIDQLSNGTQIDAIIAATLSPDYSFPGIGVQIQDALGLPPVPAYDVRNQCSGFLYAMEMGGALISTGVYENILIVGAEVHSTGMDKTTRGRDIAVLFGDGAGSCILSHGKRSGLSFELVGTELHSDGAYAKELWCEHPGSVLFPDRLTEELVREGKVFPEMNGRLVFENAVRHMTEVSLSLLAKHGYGSSDVSLFLPHQANLRINTMVAQKLGLNESQVFSTIQDYGNTTAATIPIGFTRAVEEGAFTSGDLVLSAAFGSGFTWGAALYRVV